MMKQIKIIFFALALMVVSSTAFSAGFEFLGPEGDWDVFADKKSGAQVCYIASVPENASHADRRGEIYVLITRRAAEGFKDVVSFHQGYPLDTAKEVKVSIGSKTFLLFASGETAWAYETKDDIDLVKAMKAGSTMKVEAMSSRGTATTDNYSLGGITAAYNKMAAACK